MKKIIFGVVLVILLFSLLNFVSAYNVSCETDDDCKLDVPSKLSECLSCDPYGCNTYDAESDKVIAINKDWEPDCPETEPPEICAACSGAINVGNYITKCIDNECTKTAKICPAIACTLEDCPYGCEVNEAGCVTGRCNPVPEDGAGMVSCPRGCVCQGGTTTCPVEDETIDVEVDEGPTQGQTGQVSTGTIKVPITITKQGDKIKIKSGEVEVFTSEKVSVIESKLTMEMSNGRKAEIKIMPETASETAITRLGELNFTIELKEIGKGDETKAIYEVKAKKQGRFLGLFKIKGEVQIQIDSETGEIISVKKPWWSFLASGI